MINGKNFQNVGKRMTGRKKLKFMKESGMNLIGEEKTFKRNSLFINQIHVLIYKLYANFNICFREIIKPIYFKMKNKYNILLSKNYVFSTRTH